MTQQSRSQSRLQGSECFVDYRQHFAGQSFECSKVSDREIVSALSYPVNLILYFQAVACFFKLLPRLHNSDRCQPSINIMYCGINGHEIERLDSIIQLRHRHVDPGVGGLRVNGVEHDQSVFQQMHCGKQPVQIFLCCLLSLETLDPNCADNGEGSPERCPCKVDQQLLRDARFATYHRCKPCRNTEPDRKEGENSKPRNQVKRAAVKSLLHRWVISADGGCDKSLSLESAI